MQLSPFSKPTVAAKERWLKNQKAAELLGVEMRTIKRWMENPARRKALGAVRHGKQWRIPRPADEWIWEFQTRRHLKEAGIDLKPSWEQAFDRQDKENERYELESYRLWLAAHLQLLERERITEEDITEILLLWQTACKILGSLPEGTEVDKLKTQFPESLRVRNFSEEEIRSIMSYWPEQKLFKQVRAAHTLKQLEKIRRGVDTAQATKTCNNLGQKPTAENLRPLFHKDWMTHINDTREELPGTVVKNPTPEQLEAITMASVYDQIQGKPLPAVSIDFRQPQNGLALRTFRNRHPLKKSPQKEIIAAVCDYQDNIPGVDERPHTRKTPIRDSTTP